MEKIIDEIMIKYGSEKTLVIGIDGLGGAGKSTMVNLLKQKLQSNNHHALILHIDNFIHPRHVRYDESKEEWQCYYSIQWRYDYLIEEILAPIKEAFKIDKQIELYEKEKDTYILKSIEIPLGSILLIEGIFLQRKEIKKYFDYIIYLEVPKEVRLNRVINRDIYIGDMEDIKSKYERRYFPAEDKYIKEYSPAKNADFLLNGV